MNPSSAYRWQGVKDKEFSFEDLARLLTSNYTVDSTTALKDGKEIGTEWIKAGIAER